MIGETVSHYRVVEKIGSGGMGQVYLAEDTKLERKVALKFLPHDMTSDAEARQRFEREARAAAALSHPNIVTVYEIGEHEGGVFIAMEYARGRTLKEVIQDSLQSGRPLPVGLAVRIAAQIAAGLGAAHARGIVHRDIKPQNIIVGEDLGVKILDFGLAKLSGISTLTKGSMMMGTMHYISPEQARGREADARSDLWALGVVLYEMLSGRLPFAGESPHAILYSVVKSSPNPVDEYRPGLPAPLLACVKRLLAKDPDRRYQDSGEFMADLEGLQGLPEEEGTEVLRLQGRGRWYVLDGIGRFFLPAGSPSGAQRRARRRKWIAVTLALGAGAALFILSPGARDMARRGLGIGNVPGTKHLAVLPIAASGAGESRALADGFTALLAEKLTLLEKFPGALWTVPASEILAERGRSRTALQRLWGCNLFISGDLHVENNSLRLRLRLEDARTAREMKRVEITGHMGNLSLFQDGLLARILELLALAEPPEAARHVNWGGTAMPGAFALFLKAKGLVQSRGDAGRLEEGIVLLEKALRQDDGYLQARLALAAALLARHQLGRERAVLQRARAEGQRVVQAAAPWAPAQLTWGLILNESGEKEKARAALRETLRLDERCYAACIELARLYAATGRMNEAERLYKRAGSLRPGYPSALAHLAYLYMLNGRIDEALALYREQAGLAPGDFAPFNNMGNIFVFKNDRASAKSMYERSIAIQPNAVAQSNLATLLFYEGDYRKALPIFREIAANGENCRWWGNLADTYRQLPEYRHQAAAAYRRAIDMAEAALAKNAGDYELMSVLAMYYAHAGDRAGALATIARARALAPADLETIRRAILTYEAAGERSRALDALREFRERLGGIEEVEKEPDLAALRRDPEYRNILHGNQ